MNRKILSLLAAGILLLPSLGLAVGLGSVRTYSNLNERLVAEISVLSVSKKGEMSVSLASNEEFARRGLQRATVLNDLRFRLVERRGRVYVAVTSEKQIAVPYLNFILQLNMGEDVISREYAIFLDPVVSQKKKNKASKLPPKSEPYKPSSTNAMPVVAKSDGTHQKKNNVSKRLPKSMPDKPSSTNAIPVVAKSDVMPHQMGRYGPVKRGESFWTIAIHTRPSRAISINKMVAALKEANPHIGSVLPSGIVLNVPTFAGYKPFSDGNLLALQSKKKS